jgi:hypothetical protein
MVKMVLASDEFVGERSDDPAAQGNKAVSVRKRAQASAVSHGGMRQAKREPPEPPVRPSGQRNPKKPSAWVVLTQANAWMQIPLWVLGIVLANHYLGGMD